MAAHDSLFSLKSLLVKQPKALLKCPARCMYFTLVAQTYRPTPLQFSKHIHMCDPISPSQQLRNIVLVDVRLVCVRKNLTRRVWHLSDWPKARPRWLSDNVSITCEVDSTGPFEDEKTEAQQS